jgi:hypothetical protein
MFDFNSRRVGLAGGRKVALLHDEAAREFKGFFDEQFAAAKEASPADAPAALAEPKAESRPEPAATP